MKKLVSVFFILALIFSIAGPAQTQAAPLQVIPTFSIVSVVTDSTVTIQTYNFPAHRPFNVLMGRMGTRGVNGILVDSIRSGQGGSFTHTYNIPAGLKGLYRIAIRLEATDGSGYFAYNWFYNNPSGSNIGGGGETWDGYTGYPTISITGVNRDQNVTVRGYNFPANDTFNVLMGYIGTRGVNGIKVATLDTGSGGQFTQTFNIPAGLAGLRQISIRLESSRSGYYAYNWFWNNTSGSGTGGGDGNPPPWNGYTGYPTFSINSVVRNQTVTVTTSNLPPNDRFAVLMGPMGTRGINGYRVATIDTGAGGKQTLTFDVPAELAGSYQISIRMQSVSGSGFYAYNWFYNNTAY